MDRVGLVWATCRGLGGGDGGRGHGCSYGCGSAWLGLAEAPLCAFCLCRRPDYVPFDASGRAEGSSVELEFTAIPRSIRRYPIVAGGQLLHHVLPTNKALWCFVHASYS